MSYINGGHMEKELSASADQGEFSEQSPKLWTKNFILIIIINLITFFGFQMLTPTLPLYVAKLGGSQTEAGFVIGIFAISAVFIRPLAGRGLDLYGRKGIFIAGLGIFLISALAYNWVPTVLALLVLRFVHGFGWGASSTASGTIASDVIPRKRLGEGMGYFGIAGDVAMAVGPALGLFLSSSLGFPTLFFSSAGAILIAMVLAILITLHRDNPVGGDVKPTIRPSYFEKSAFRPSLVMFFVTMTFGAIISFLAMYASQLGISNVGLFFTLYALALMISRPLFGRIADKRDNDIIIAPGMLAIFASLIILSQAGVVGHPYGMLLLAGVVYGFGFGAVQPSLQAMAIRNVPFNRRGAANATFFSSFDLGIGLGSALWGVIAEVAGYNMMYLVASVSALCALGCYLFFGRRK